MRNTSKYKLPLWDLADLLKRTDLNAVSEKAESALVGLDADLSRAVFRSGSTLTTRSGSSISVPASQVSGRLQIATGSYTGTGLYGASNPTRITFPFSPKLLIVGELTPLGLDSGDAYWQDSFLWTVGQRTVYVYHWYTSGDKGSIYITVSGNTISWYSTDGPSVQLSSGTRRYLAIG